MRKKAIKTVLIALIAITITAGGFIGYKSFAADNKTETKSNYFTVVANKTGIAVNVASTGTVYASVTRDIVSNNSGEVKNLNVKEGDTVKAGDKLFTADSTQLRQQVDSAKLNLEKQELQMNKMKTEDDKNLQYLQIKDAKNSLNSANQQYSGMTVAAPLDGVVTARNNNNGDIIQSGKTVLSVMDPNSLKIKATIDELDISKVKVGQKAEVKFNAIEGKTFEGTVESISSVGTTTNNVTTYGVVISLNDKTGVMLGMTANVSIQVESKEDALVVPTEAVTDRNGKKYVMVPNEDSGAAAQAAGNRKTGGNNGTQARNGIKAGTTMQGRLVEVKTGIQNENFIEITDGISEGQKVMIQLPQTNSATANSQTKNAGGFGFGGGMAGGAGRARSGN